MILEKSLGLHVLGQWTNTHESSSNFCCYKLGKLFIWSTGSPWYFSCKTCATRFVMLLEVPVEPLILARDSLYIYICIFLKSLHMHIYNYIYIYIYIYIYTCIYIYRISYTYIISSLHHWAPLQGFCNAPTWRLVLRQLGWVDMWGATSWQKPWVANSLASQEFLAREWARGNAKRMYNVGGDDKTDDDCDHDT